MNAQKPQIDLREIAQHTVKFLFDEPLEKEGQYGVYWIYTVEHEGTEKIFFANEYLHGIIHDAGMKKGSIITIDVYDDGGKYPKHRLLQPDEKKVEKIQTANDDRNASIVAQTILKAVSKTMNNTASVLREDSTLPELVNISDSEFTSTFNNRCGLYAKAYTRLIEIVGGVKIEEKVQEEAPVVTDDEPLPF